MLDTHPTLSLPNSLEDVLAIGFMGLILLGCLVGFYFAFRKPR